jgi:hypothetical protein
MDTIGDIIVKCQKCGEESIVTLTKADKSFVRCRKCKTFIFEYKGVRGYIYVLSNPKMPGLLKIGFSVRPLQERIIELSSATGVPAPFELEAAFVSADPQDHERQIHALLAEYRVPSREFFTVHISKALSVAESVCSGSPVYLNAQNKHFKRILDTDRGENAKRLNLGQ